MAKVILLNCLRLGTDELLAGDEFDTVLEAAQITKIAAAGGVLAPKENTQVLAAQALVLSARKRGGAAISTDELTSMMLSAALAPLLKQKFDVTLVAGTRTVNTNITVTADTSASLALKTHGGTAGTRYLVALTVGGPGTGAIVITAVDTAGATVATDTSTLTVTLEG